MPRKDSSSQKRKRGKDKQRERYEKNGKYSSKHMRSLERAQESRAQKPKPPEQKK